MIHHPLKLAIVIPCYNEGDVIELCYATLLSKIQSLTEDGLISDDSFIIFCNDGSQDNTWEIISRLHSSCKNVGGICLAHNRGQQTALFAGLEYVADKCDAAVTMDVDLQDDPEVIKDMILKITEGNDIVYGVRNSRPSDSSLKRISAKWFYSLQKRLGLETIPQHADFRMLSARALSMLLQYDERVIFLRGIIPQLGLDSAIVKYTRQPRIAGDSKYPLKNMLGLAIDGITSFSARPMRLIFIVGLVLCLVSIFIGIYVLTAYFNRTVIMGWSSIMISIWFLGSLLLMSVGIVGEYIGKIFTEVKHRPRFILKDTLSPE